MSTKKKVGNPTPGIATLSHSRKEKPKPSSQLIDNALTAISCNWLMLEICDNLKETEFYHQKRKQLIDTLSRDLEGFMNSFYEGIDDEQQKRYYGRIDILKKLLGRLGNASGETLNRVDSF